MGVFRQKSGIHPFFLSESYEIGPLRKNTLSLKEINIFP